MSSSFCNLHNKANHLLFSCPDGGINFPYIVEQTKTAFLFYEFMFYSFYNDYPVKMRIMRWIKVLVLTLLWIVQRRLVLLDF